LQSAAAAQAEPEAPTTTHFFVESLQASPLSQSPAQEQVSVSFAAVPQASTAPVFRQTRPPVQSAVTLQAAPVPPAAAHMRSGPQVRPVAHSAAVLQLLTPAVPGLSQVDPVTAFLQIKPEKQSAVVLQDLPLVRAGAQLFVPPTEKQT
jgi:hypothetical protein